jgi:hypothetical protein
LTPVRCLSPYARRHQVISAVTSAKLWKSDKLTGQLAEAFMSTFLILGFFVFIALIGSLPVWPHSKSWGYYPSAIAALGILIIVALLIFAH